MAEAAKNTAAKTSSAAPAGAVLVNEAAPTSITETDVPTSASKSEDPPVNTRPAAKELTQSINGSTSTCVGSSTSGGGAPGSAAAIVPAALPAAAASVGARVTAAPDLEELPQPAGGSGGVMVAGEGTEGQIYYMLVDENSQLENQTILIGRDFGRGEVYGPTSFYMPKPAGLREPVHFRPDPDSANQNLKTRSGSGL